MMQNEIPTKLHFLHLSKEETNEKRIKFWMDCFGGRKVPALIPYRVDTLALKNVYMFTSTEECWLADIRQQEAFYNKYKNHPMFDIYMSFGFPVTVGNVILVSRCPVA